MNLVSPFSRRIFLQTLAGLAGTTLGSRSPAATTTQGVPDAKGLRVGQCFNESSSFRDPLTGRSVRRLTSGRRWNQQPTYHLNVCFSADSRYLALATVAENGESALLRAEVATGELVVLATLPAASGEAFSGNNLSLIQASGWVAANTGPGLRLYRIKDGRERILIPPTGERGFSGHPSGSIDGKKIFLPRRGRPIQDSGVECRPVTHLEIDIATGRQRELLVEERAQCNHVVPHPVHPDLLLIDRDWPPNFGSGGDRGQTSRVWVLNIRTSRLKEVRPRDTNRFQIHSNWSHRGDYIYYHGVSQDHKLWTKGDNFVGVADREGRVVWEQVIPRFHYGHLGVHTRRDAMLIDGLVSDNQLALLHWQESDAAGLPRIEPLAQHDSDWSKGQWSHPHPHMSPDGRWVSFNRGSDGRSDVCVVDLA